MIKSKAKDISGFTIVELLIATVVFSVVLTITVSGFLTIGRLFYKGVSTAQTNEIAKQVFNDISASIRSAPSLSDRQQGYGYRYFCLGNNRYSFAVRRVGSQDIPILYDASKPVNYDPGSPNVNFGLIKDKLPGSSACAPPCQPDNVSGCGSESSQFNNPKEMLGDKMRLVNLSIGSASGPINLYLVNITVAFGNDAVLHFDYPSPNTIKAQCSGSLSIQEFCSVVTLSSGVYRGIHP